MEESYQPQPAKVEQVPEAKIFSVEFPGHVVNLEKAKQAIGGDQAIVNASSQLGH